MYAQDSCHAINVQHVMSSLASSCRRPPLRIVQPARPLRFMSRCGYRMCRYSHEGGLVAVGATVA